MIKLLTILLVSFSANLTAQQTIDHSKHQMQPPVTEPSCDTLSMACAKTISSAVDNQGRIWSVWSLQQYLYLNYSDNLGRSYSRPRKVNNVAEKISNRGENRPKIAIDDAGNVYLSWVTPLTKRFSSNVRFSYLAANSNLFSPVVTVNNDNLLTGHSFNEMVVTDTGDVYIAWLDGRAKVAAEKQGTRLRHSEIYLAHANFIQGKTVFDNSYLTQGTCVCCRLAMDLDQHALPILMWRHVFEKNTRDHGFLTMKNQQQANPIKRVSFEKWQVDGCPHQGPSMVREKIGGNSNRVHMAWFNNASDASGLFYSYSDNNGADMSKVNNFATKTQLPEHPFLSRKIVANGTNSLLQLVWREYNGNAHQIKYQSSATGDIWSESRVIATAVKQVDYPYILQHPSGSYLHWHIIGQPLRLIKL